MRETTIEIIDRQWRGTEPTEPTQYLIDRLGELPAFELVKILRALVPAVLEQLPEGERDAFLCELGQGQ